MKTFAAPLLFAGFTLVAFALTADDEKKPQLVEIEGSWTITEASTLDGTQYGGSITITEGEGIYNVQWTTDAGSYPGIGIRKDNELFVGWGTAESGIVVYDITENGVLEGEWSYPGLEGIGTERLSPQQNNRELAGRYSLIGTNVDGGQYNGTLSITQNGDVYQLTWGGNAGPATGVAMRVGDRLVVGYGAPEGGNGIAHYHFEGNTAAGRWTVDNADALATENLEK